MQTSISPISTIWSGISKALQAIALAVASLLLTPIHTHTHAQTFTIDTSATSPLTGLWWNANESGWGATITQQSSIMFVTMFAYDAAGSAVWYTVSCTITGASCTGDLLRFRGGSTPIATWNGSGIAFSKVGTMTLNFTGNDSGSMIYTLDGLASSKQITRQIFGPLPPVIPGLSGQWQGSIIETRTNCTQSQINGVRATYGQYDISMSGGPSGAIAIALAGVTGLQCTYSGNYTTNGARLLANGNLVCSDGKRGTWQSTTMQVMAKSMSLEFGVQLDTTETCTIAAILGGLRP